MKIINLHPLIINGLKKCLISKNSCANKECKVPKQTRKDVLKPNLPSYDGQCLWLRLFQWTCLIADLETSTPALLIVSSPLVALNLSETC